MCIMLYQQQSSLSYLSWRYVLEGHRSVLNRLQFSMCVDIHFRTEQGYK